MASGLWPLLVLFIVVCVLGTIGYIVYMIVDDVQKQTKQKMEKKNIRVSREGMKVGVKQVSSEQVSDSTQKCELFLYQSPQV